MRLTTVGIDLTKSIFQVHAVIAAWYVVLRKALGQVQVVSFFARHPRCLVGMEACGAPHHWARELGPAVRCLVRFDTAAELPRCQRALGPDLAHGQSLEWAPEGGRSGRRL